MKNAFSWDMTSYNLTLQTNAVLHFHGRSTLKTLAGRTSKTLASSIKLQDDIQKENNCSKRRCGTSDIAKRSRSHLCLTYYDLSTTLSRQKKHKLTLFNNLTTFFLSPQIKFFCQSRHSFPTTLF